MPLIEYLYSICGKYPMKLWASGRSITRFDRMMASVGNDTRCARCVDTLSAIHNAMNTAGTSPSVPISSTNANSSNPCGTVLFRSLVFCADHYMNLISSLVRHLRCGTDLAFPSSVASRLLETSKRLRPMLTRPPRQEAPIC